MGSDFEAVGLWPEQTHISKEASESTKAIGDSKFMGTKGGSSGTSRSPGLKEIMNGSGGNFAKGLLIKPAIDWLRANGAPISARQWKTWAGRMRRVTGCLAEIRGQ